jgi:hypothetical protein
MRVKIDLHSHCEVHGHYFSPNCEEYVLIVVRGDSDEGPMDQVRPSIPKNEEGLATSIGESYGPYASISE